MKTTPRGLALLALLFALAASAPAATVHISGNGGATITINDNSTASPYPSNATVSGISANTLTKVQVILAGFTHTYPADVDVLLVGPQGQRCMLMSDAGGGHPGVSNVNLTFSSTAATVLPTTAPATGTYRPANYPNDANSSDLTDTFPSPGPGTLTDQPADLTVFNLTNPNGTWRLYVVDDTAGDVGSINGGWALLVTVPTIFTVTNANDSGPGSLRDALAAAGNDDLINFSPLFNNPQTINLLTALPVITKSVTIQGPGANLLTVRRDYNAATDFTIFNIASGVANGVAISGMTFSNGRDMGGPGQDGFGGGIDSQSALTLTNVHVTGNQAVSGGGIALGFAGGVFTGCTFSGNTSTADGGGINYQGDGGHTLRLVSSTVSGNKAFNSNGGGVFNVSASGNSRVDVVNSTIANNTGAGITTFTVGVGTTATTTLRNTIIAGNTPNNLATGTSGGGAATFQTLGFNLSDNYNGVFTLAATDINAAPLLGPLSLNGGQTPTHALLGGSPALDKGNASGLTSDQRGVPRVFGTAADIGAVEMQAIIVTTLADTGPGSLRAAITAANANGAGLDDIIFSGGLSGTINLESALPDIASSLTINGPGANLLTVRRAYDATADFGIFNIPSGGLTVAMNSITINNGNGSGIQSQSDLILTNVHLTGNSAFEGGGVNLYGANGVFTGCTFSGNTSSYRGGAIYFAGHGGHTLRVANSTISGNQAGSDSSGIENYSDSDNGQVEIVSSTIANNSGPGCGAVHNTGYLNGVTITTLRNSIVAANTPYNFTTDHGGGGGAYVNSLGYNLSDDYSGEFGPVVSPGNTDQTGDPKLGPLSLNSGTTPTHALLGGSPALDAGNSSGGTTDQRGLVRPFDIPSIPNAAGGDGSDIGAVEMQAVIVTSTSDNGAGSLRDAITTANSNGAGLDDILFDNTVFSTRQTINLQTALPDITSSLTINGPGANLLTVQRASNAATNFRVFNVVSGITNGVAISGMTITGGNAGTGNTLGGGIFSVSNLTLTKIHVTGNTAGSGGGVTLGDADGVFINCTFSNNSTTFAAGGGGGGIYYQGDGGHTLRLVSSTVSGNKALNSDAGGIGNVSFSDSSTLVVMNSTIANNAGVRGGGIFTYTSGAGTTATTTLRNSIVAGNSPNNLANSTANSGGAATVQTLGFNLANDNGGGFLNVAPITTDKINANAGLGPLAFNGGPTPTHALMFNSAALDAGNNSGSGTLFDQRGPGFPRTTDYSNIPNASGGDGTDIGAVEGTALTITAISHQTNGHTLLQGFGAPNLTDTVEASPDLSPGSFVALPTTVTADGTGALQYDDATAVGLTKRFYRLRFP